MNVSDDPPAMIAKRMDRVNAVTYSRAVEEFAEWLDGKDGSETIWALSLVARFLASRKEPSDG
jgi:hypothetical protein